MPGDCGHGDHKSCPLDIAASCAVRRFIMLSAEHWVVEARLACPCDACTYRLLSMHVGIDMRSCAALNESGHLCRTLCSRSHRADWTSRESICEKGVARRPTLILIRHRAAHVYISIRLCSFAPVLQYSNTRDWCTFKFLAGNARVQRHLLGSLPGVTITRRSQDSRVLSLHQPIRSSRARAQQCIAQSISSRATEADASRASEKGKAICFPSPASVHLFTARRAEGLAQSAT